MIRLFTNNCDSELYLDPELYLFASTVDGVANIGRAFQRARDKRSSRGDNYHIYILLSLFHDNYHELYIYIYIYI